MQKSEFLILTLLFVVTLFAIQVTSVNVIEFRVVYPVNSEQGVVHVNVRSGSFVQMFSMVTNLEDNLTHSYNYSTESSLSPEMLDYQYEIIFNNGTNLKENFWRVLEPCRLSSTTTSNWVTKYEYFNQTETVLGVEDVPRLGGAPIPTPWYFDDNQVMTVSFSVTDADLQGILFNPNDDGEVYVRANMTLVSLDERHYFVNMKIRRAGGMSLSIEPYSFQLKVEIEIDGQKIESVIKLKAYGTDYSSGSFPNIIAEKAASDICVALGAPINYISYVRVMFNGEQRGMYGMVEKVDEGFIERRWPYIALGQDVGTLYKTIQANWYLVDNQGVRQDIETYNEQQAAYSPYCCPCFDNNCDVDGDCDVFDDDDEICQTLSCCSCPWDIGQVNVQTSNCASQEPFQDYVTLANTVIGGSQTSIEQILDGKSFLKSVLASLVIMNADGYMYNGKNYYWYRDSVSGQFELILYDQDKAFFNSQYTNNNWNPYQWTVQGDLSDSQFLTILLQDPGLYDFYTQLAIDFLSQYYRQDRQGPMYQRMTVYGDFIQKYNPERGDVEHYTDGYIDWFILPLSKVLTQQFGISLSPVSPSSPATCSDIISE